MVRKAAEKDGSARARRLGAAFLGAAMLTMPGGLRAQSALEQLQREPGAAGAAETSSAKVEPAPAGAPAAQSPVAAPADGKYHLGAEQLAGLRRLVDYLDRNTQFKDASQDGHEFSIRTRNGDSAMIFMYRTVTPGLLRKPRTYVFTLWMGASGGDVDSSVTVIGDWDVGAVNEAASRPSKLEGLRRKMLRREQGNGPRDREESLSDPAMRKMLQEELNYWAGYRPGTGSRGGA